MLDKRLDEQELRDYLRFHLYLRFVLSLVGLAWCGGMLAWMLYHLPDKRKDHPVTTDTTTLSDVQANKQAREDAEALLALAGDESRPRFWEKVIELAKQRLPAEPDEPTGPVPMTEVEAVIFEGTKMPFGIHQGKQVWEVPTTYWHTLTNSRFNKDLKRYLLSDRYKRSQPDQD